MVRRRLGVILFYAAAGFASAFPVPGPGQGDDRSAGRASNATAHVSLQATVHAALDCAACHAGFIRREGTPPHQAKKDLPPPTCGAVLPPGAARRAGRRGPGLLSRQRPRPGLPRAGGEGSRPLLGLPRDPRHQVRRRPRVHGQSPQHPFDLFPMPRGHGGRREVQHPRGGALSRVSPQRPRPRARRPGRDRIRGRLHRLPWRPRHPGGRFVALARAGAGDLRPLPRPGLRGLQPEHPRPRGAQREPRRSAVRRLPRRAHGPGRGRGRGPDGQGARPRHVFRLPRPARDHAQVRRSRGPHLDLHRELPRHRHRDGGDRRGQLRRLPRRPRHPARPPTRGRRSSRPTCRRPAVRPRAIRT